MFVFGLGDNKTLIYNPVRLTSNTLQKMKELNQTPIALVIGNKDHLLFFVDWVKQFPSIKCYCPPGFFLKGIFFFVFSSLIRLISCFNYKDSKSLILEKLKAENVSTDKLFIQEIDNNVIVKDFEKAGLVHHVVQGIPEYNESKISSWRMILTKFLHFPSYSISEFFKDSFCDRSGDVY